MAIKLADTTRPNNYTNSDNPGTFPVAYAENVWLNDGTDLETFLADFDGNGGVQKEELPLASAAEEGNIYQYIGATGTYTNGYFYKCVEDSGSYSWINIQVQDAGAETIVDVNSVPVSEISNVIYRTTDLSGDASYYAGNETASDTDQLAKYSDIQIIQVETLGTANSTLEGTIVQYIGATGNGLYNGYFYKCVEVETSQYEWVAWNVQEDGGTLYADTPIGTIQAYGGTTAPTGWFLCQGQAISRTEYADLFNAIGTTFGSGDGSTTFNVPDLRETVPVGSGTRGNGVTNHDTYTVGQFKDDQLQEHTHNVICEFGAYPSPDFSPLSSDNSYCQVSGLGTTTRYSVDGTATTNTGRTGTTTHGKQLGVNYIIKAKHTSIPADFIDAVDEAVDEAVAGLTPVDAVTSGDMNPVTSNAVAKMCKRVSVGSLPDKVIPTTGTVITQITLPKGKWMIFGQLHTNGFSTANQLLTLAISVNGSAASSETVDQKVQVPGCWVFVHGMLYLEPTTEVTVKLVAVATEQITGVVKAEMMAIPVS